MSQVIYSRTYKPADTNGHGERGWRIGENGNATFGTLDLRALTRKDRNAD